MLISNKEKQAEIMAEKNKVIVDSLVQAMQYIDVKTAMELLNYSRGGTLKVLRRLAEMKLVKEHEVKTSAGRKILIFGLSNHGRDIEDPNLKPWSLKKYRVLTSRHDMLLHILLKDIKIQILPKAKNHQFKQTQIIKLDKKTHRPDLCYELENKLYPIELELTYKAKSRYQLTFAIYRSYYERFKVAPIWIFTNENEARRFYNLGLKINYKYSNSIMDIYFWTENQTLEFIGVEPINKFKPKVENLSIKTNKEIKDTITELKEEIEGLEDSINNHEWSEQRLKIEHKETIEEKNKTINQLVKNNREHQLQAKFLIGATIFSIVTALYSIYIR